MQIANSSSHHVGNLSVAVIGAGPAGLAVAAELSKRGIAVTIYDKHGSPGGAFDRMYASLVLTTPKSLLELVGCPINLDASHIMADQYASYLRNISNQYGLKILKGTILRLTDTGTSVKLEMESGSRHEASIAIVATGMSETPIIPEWADKLAPRPANVIHSSQWPGPNDIIGPRVIIVGAGQRGIEIAEECAAFGHQVLVSCSNQEISFVPKSIFGSEYRHWLAWVVSKIPIRWMRMTCQRGFHPLPHDAGFRKYEAQGAIKRVDDIAELSGGSVTTTSGAQHIFDTIVLATGFRFDAPFLPKDFRTALGGPNVRNGRVIGSSRIFAIGFPCAYKLDSQFIQGIGRDAATLVNQATHLRCNREAVTDAPSQ